MMYCTTCGKEIRPDKPFCKYCGARVLPGEGARIYAGQVRSEKNTNADIGRKGTNTGIGRKGRIAAISIGVAVLILVAVLAARAEKQRKDTGEWVTAVQSALQAQSEKAQDTSADMPHLEHTSAPAEQVVSGLQGQPAPAATQAPTTAPAMASALYQDTQFRRYKDAVPEDRVEAFMLEGYYRVYDTYELYSFSQDEIRLILNGLYAMSGNVFSKKSNQDYFNSKSWYVPISESVDDTWFNEYQRANMVLLVEHEKNHGWR